MVDLVLSDRAQHARDHAAGRAAEVQIPGSHRPHVDVTGLSQRDETLKVSDAAVEAIRVPGDHGLHETGLNVGQERLVLRSP
ncbi:MAG TPA: hypothetical protein VIK32_10385, partial [Candidatus Limnocylindrales bacterium]